MRKTTIVLFVAAAVCWMSPACQSADKTVDARASLVAMAGALSAGDGQIAIVGPRECEVGNLTKLSITGLPPIDSSKPLDETLIWLKTLKIGLDQPPEQAQPVIVELSIRLVATPQFSWRLDLEFTPPVAGDYVMACDWNEGSNQLVMYRVRAGSGPNPPPPPIPTPNPVLSVSPAVPFSSMGPAGGPFDPPSISYTLSNTGQGDLHWQARVSADWLSAKPVSGTIAAGQTQAVEVGVSGAAKSLEAGIHAGMVFFDNMDNEQGNAVRLALLVVSGEPAPPLVTQLWGIVIEESHDRTAQQAIILTSKDVRAAFDGRFRLIDKDNTETGSVKQWIDRAVGKKLPYLFLTNESGQVVWEGALPETIDGMLELMRKHAPAERDPIDQEFFEREHWRLTPGDCGMMNCPIHKNYWIKEPVEAKRKPRFFRRQCGPNGCKLIPVY